jgi:hypothetical protein
MSFTYDPREPDDVTRVRFYTGQTVEDESLLSDEDIGFALSENSNGVGAAVVMCFGLIIRKLSKPDFKADWLQVSNDVAIKSYRAELAAARVTFSIPAPAVTATIRHAYRKDSHLTEEPTYSIDEDQLPPWWLP